ncbi:MAG: DUF1844 domain-containing protein [Deltaproteobacteria bacterium]|nr:DUF1844 domain-containing protein [Deltaproteobacteria bacterium]
MTDEENKKTEEWSQEETKNNNKDEAKKEEDLAGNLPTVNFSTFVLSLSTSAMISLGEIESPVSKKKEKSQPMARHSIDLIELLKEKTKGNLDENEEKLIDGILYDLRTRYLNAFN